MSFASLPNLPVVPPPAPGEALGSWIYATAAALGMTGRHFLRWLGTPDYWIGHQVDSDLVFRPRPEHIDGLARVTGLSRSDLMRMTLQGVDAELRAASQHQAIRCMGCENEATLAAGRPVRLLQGFTAWRLACPSHPRALDRTELETDSSLGVFFRKLAAAIEFLDRAALNREAFPKLMGTSHAFTAGDFLHVVYQINAHFRLAIREPDNVREIIEFRILQSSDPVDGVCAAPLPKIERNSIEISIVLAWQLVNDTAGTAIAAIRTANSRNGKNKDDLQQIWRLTQLLLEFFSEATFDVIGTSTVRRFLCETAWLPTNLTPDLSKVLEIDPRYPERLGELRWNYRHILQAVISDGALYRRSKGPRFQPIWPFRSRDARTELFATAIIRNHRAIIWSRPGWYREEGSQRFESRYLIEKPPARRQDLEILAELSRSDIRAHQAVEAATKVCGRIRRNLSPRDRKREVRKLFAAARKQLDLLNNRGKNHLGP